MAKPYSLANIADIFLGKDALGRDAIIYNRISFLRGQTPEYIADAVKSGYLTHVDCFINLPYPIIGDWDDAVAPITQINEFTLTEDGIEQLKLYAGKDLAESKEATHDIWQVQWKEQAKTFCCKLCDSLANSEILNGETILLLDNCKNYFTNGCLERVTGRELTLTVLLSYVIEYIAREQFVYKSTELEKFTLCNIKEEEGWVRFSFENAEGEHFDIRADGFMPTFISAISDAEDYNELQDVSSIATAIKLNTYLHESANS